MCQPVCFVNVPSKASTVKRRSSTPGEAPEASAVEDSTGRRWGQYSNEEVSGQLTIGSCSSVDLPGLATVGLGQTFHELGQHFQTTEIFGVHGGLERLGEVSQAVGPDSSNSPFEVHINWYR